MELYAEAFASVGKIHMLPKFANENGRKFYGDVLNKIPFTKPRQKIRLFKFYTHIPKYYSFGNNYVKPLRAGAKIFWKFSRIV